MLAVLVVLYCCVYTFTLFVCVVELLPLVLIATEPIGWRFAARGPYGAVDGYDV